MKNSSHVSGLFKFIIGWSAVFLIRLIPFRPANFEPMLSVMMPFGKRYGAVSNFLFGFLSIALFDAVTSGIGMWTAVTAVAYGCLGIAAHYFFRNREGSIGNFVLFGIAGTLAYDAVTGLSVGPLFFAQPFMEAFIGQIPFTLMHLLGAVLFSLSVSPLLMRWVVSNEALEMQNVARLIGATR